MFLFLVLCHISRISDHIPTLGPILNLMKLLGHTYTQDKRNTYDLYEVVCRHLQILFLIDLSCPVSILCSMKYKFFPLGLSCALFTS